MVTGFILIVGLVLVVPLIFAYWLGYKMGQANMRFAIVRRTDRGF